MPNCKLCHKPLDEETADALCESCRTMKENLLAEQWEAEKRFRENRRINWFVFGFVILLIVICNLSVAIGNWKAASRAEQLVIETVQTEAGYTPFASGSVAFTTPVDKIVFVNYGLTKESLNAPDCPYYVVSVSGKYTKLLPFEHSSAEQSPP